MKPRLQLVMWCVVLSSACMITVGGAAARPQDDQVRMEPGRPFFCGAEPCDAVARGFRAFVDRRLHALGGDGRTRADCHLPTDRVQLSPASAEARFRFRQWRRQFGSRANDPLFLPMDADDFRTYGDAGDDFRYLRENGL